jgi:hypothetical protein
MALAAPPRERPILFSGPMVRAVLDGRKTQTRRVVKHPGDFLGAGGRHGGDWDDPRLWGWEDPEHPSHFIVLAREPEPGDVPVRCPYGVPGDRLWCRETWAPAVDDNGRFAFYAASNPDPSPFSFRWRPSIHMPRWASRISLEIAEVRVQRLREIGAADIVAEGIHPIGPEHHPKVLRDDFRTLWDSINGKRPVCAWDDNPWVWAISFRRLEG